ncbi:MAG: CHAT domain-containing protein, partial [Deltaproteobacteria bacterium]|nr:CHAT domain-containing protein [Deltaproteobacteria bacterium]
RQGETDEALHLYRERLDGSTLNPRAPEQLQLITGYARLLAEQPGGAEEAFNRLNSACQTLDAEVSDVLLDERRAEMIANVIEVHDALIEILTGPAPPVLQGRGNARVLAFDLHESAKSRTTLSTLADSPMQPPAYVPKGLSDEETKLLEAERSYQRDTEVRSEEYRERRLREIRAGLKDCWNRMRQIAPDYVRFRSGEPCTFDEVRAALAAITGVRAAFVSFFCGKSNTAVFVVRSDAYEPFVFQTPLGWQAWNDIGRRIRRVFNGAPAEFPPYPHILRDRPFQRSLDFFDQAASSLLKFLPAVEGCELLCMALHGPLHVIPIHAMRTSSGDYLARRFAIVYNPSLSIAAQFLSRSESGDARPSVFVAGTSAAEDTHPEYFEAEAAIFDPSQWRITAAVGASACSRRAVLDALPHQDVIHLSCHGFFNELNALDSGLLLSDGSKKPPRNPQSLSVMERQNFLISVRDLLRVRLNARLVTLNACSSGLQGQRNAGDELDGFSRALLLAGASCVMLGLWNVDQQSSGEFMRRFYRHWAADGRPSQKWRAIHSIQLEFMNSPEPFLRHPYHWAPFAISGDWR